MKLFKLKPARFKPVYGLALILCLGACSQPIVEEQKDEARRAKLAPLLGTDRPHVISGEYIAVFHQNVDTKALNAKSVGGLTTSLGLDPQSVNILKVYGHVLQGFSAKLSSENLRKLRANPKVKYVTANAKVYLKNIPWGLDRIDQKDLPLNNKFDNKNVTASNITAFILDSGINTQHSDFGGRAAFAKNLTGDGKDYDCHGHGSHVAGTVGGNQYGVAKGVKLIAVKVMGCHGGGKWDWIIAGLDWAVQQKTSPAVVNLSVGGGKHEPTNEAIQNAISKGLTVVAAAGNNNADACNNTPGMVKEAIIVMASNQNDQRSPFSDYGSCGDLFAPGRNITSTWKEGNAVKTLNGTSMAASHVTGAAALLLAQNPNMTQAQVKAKLLENSTKGKIKNAGSGSPNRLLFVGSDHQQPDGKVYEGNVNLNSSSFQPNGTKGFDFAGGTLKANLSSTANGDFDLYLQKKEGMKWIDVAGSTNKGHSEEITYNAASGKYRWEIYAYEGSGAYQLTESRE